MALPFERHGFSIHFWKRTRGFSPARAPCTAAGGRSTLLEVAGAVDDDAVALLRDILGQCPLKLVGTRIEGRIREDWTFDVVTDDHSTD